MTNEIKMKIAETMKNLEESILKADLALMFGYERELTRFMGEEFSMGFIDSIAKANENAENIAIDSYLTPLFKEAIGGEQ